MRLTEVHTPSLVVDLPTMMENLERMQSGVQAAGAALRPHAKTHKCVEIVERQRALGATGIAAATVREAEVLFEASGRDVMIANEVVSPAYIQRLFRLAQDGRVGLLVDSEEGLRRLEAEAVNWPTTLEVYLDLNITDLSGNTGRCGVPPGGEAKRLAALMHQSERVNFQGILGYRGAPRLMGPELLEENDPVAEVRRSGIEEGEILVRFARELERAGIPVPNVVAGSTPTALAAASVPGVTEVQPGEYPFYGGIHAGPGVCAPADCAAWVVATVISRPHPNRAVINAGKKVLSGDIHPQKHPNLSLRGFGVIQSVTGEPVEGATLASLSEEHGTVTLESETAALQVGDLVRVVPNHICPVVNLSDWLLIHQDGEIVDEWRIAAKGYRSAE